MPIDLLVSVPADTRVAVERRDVSLIFTNKLKTKRLNESLRHADTARAGKSEWAGTTQKKKTNSEESEREKESRRKTLES